MLITALAPFPAPSRPALRLAAGPFFTTPEQRIALARERFFEEGVRPSGLVSELVIQSWTRCVGARRRPNESISMAPPTRSRIANALVRSRQLLEAARDDLAELDAVLAGSSCKALLTGPDGVVVHATPTAGDEGGLMPMLARVGNDLGEASVGTGAPGVSARTGEVCVVTGAEHFFAGFGTMHCAAAPIRDTRGEIAGVLDLSCEAVGFRFDAAAMARLYATAIENRLLRAQSREHLLLCFQSSPGLLGTPLEGMAAVDGSGRVRWINGAGARLLAAGEPDARPTVEQTFGLDLEALLALAHADRARPHRVPGGLAMWIAAHRPAQDGRAGPRSSGVVSGLAALGEARPPAEAAGSGGPLGGSGPLGTLVDAQRSLIDDTLRTCSGNVSRAARQLGVSRGLIYRHLREQRADAAATPDAEDAPAAPDQRPNASLTLSTRPVSPAS